jgi:hypothetical protein
MPEHARLTFALLACTLLSGCADPNAVQQAGGAAAGAGGAPLRAKNWFLDARDLEKFRAGRSKAEILNEIQWRGEFEFAGMRNGESVSAIAYKLFSNGPDGDGEGGEVVEAVFVGGKFVKFVKSAPLPADATEEYEVDGGGKATRPKPIKVGDLRWYVPMVEAQPVNVADLEREVKANPPTPSHVDYGPLIPVASEEDLKRNAALREQFNASRLEIGMNEADVEAAFKAKPILSGTAAAGRIRIYGSTESFDTMAQFHFSNVLVLYEDGKVAAVHTAAGPQWLEELRQWFSDLRLEMDGRDKPAKPIQR